MSLSIKIYNPYNLNTNPFEIGFYIWRYSVQFVRVSYFKDIVMQDLVIAGIIIVKNESNLYRINDFHRAAGGAKRHQPSNFFALVNTKELVDEINQDEITGAVNNQALMVVNGDNGGTFICKELVYAYAMWISPKFMLHVIRTFDNAIILQKEERDREVLEYQNQLTLQSDKLAIVKQCEPRDERTLAVIMGCTTYQVTRHFDTLVRNGYLKRREIPHTGRYDYDATTELGKLCVGKKGESLLFDSKIKDLVTLLNKTEVLFD